VVSAEDPHCGWPETTVSQRAASIGKVPHNYPAEWKHVKKKKGSLKDGGDDIGPRPGKGNGDPGRGSPAGKGHKATQPAGCT